MRARIMTSIVVAVLAVGLSAQAPSKSTWSVPRMPDGKPDMQGVWANNGMTPLERPAVWGNRATMTDAELADLKKRAQKLIDGGDAFFADELITAVLDGKTKFSSGDTQTGNYDQSWLSERIWDNRTSLIIDRRMVAFHRRRREPPSVRAHRLPRDEAAGPPIACRISV